MKVKCTKCGKVVQRTKDAVQKAAAKAGYASLESYLKDYVCGECRGENVQPKSKHVQSDKVEKVKEDRSLENTEQDEEEIDQSFEIEDEEEEKEDTSEIDELEEELDRLIAEEDEEEEVEL
jgi:hypothetical protein